MPRFQRAYVVAILGAGQTNDEADRNIARRLRQVADDFDAGARTSDVGVQVLHDGEPGGGGPCRPQKLVVSEVILVVPLPEAQSNDDDDD